MNHMKNGIHFERLTGPVPHTRAWELQKARRALVEEGAAPDTVFLLEHAPVITLGRKADPAHVTADPARLAELGIEVVATDRGGDVTYHGPGQLVAYPILNLIRRTQSVGWYLRTLEQVLIDLLDTYGLRGERLEGFTGVWVNGAKVAAIGVGIHQWVTFHGIALNVNPDPRHWACIIPCGIADKPVTSLAALLRQAPPMNEVMDRFEDTFRRRFSS